MNSINTDKIIHVKLQSITLYLRHILLSDRGLGHFRIDLLKYYNGKAQIAKKIKIVQPQPQNQTFLYIKKIVYFMSTSRSLQPVSWV